MYRIMASVGKYGRNLKQDVDTVQTLLNKVPIEWGGPDPKLVTDGIAGSKTIGAIVRFQEFQLPSVMRADGRVDPGYWSFDRLVEIAGTAERPGLHSNHVVANVPLIRQANSRSCWAAVLAMAMSHRDRKLYSELDAVQQVDRALGRSKYEDTYRTNAGIQPSSWHGFLGDAKLTRVNRTDLDATDFFQELRKQHPAVIYYQLGVVTHCTLVVGMRGDQTPFGSYLLEHDPMKGRKWTNFSTYLDNWSPVAGNPYKDTRCQIAYFN